MKMKVEIMSIKKFLCALNVCGARKLLFYFYKMMRECIGENEEIEDLINIVLNKTNISFKLNRLQTYHF